MFAQLPVAATTQRRAGRDSPRSSRNAHRGYITVVVAILFGLAFTATVLGTAAYIRSAQTLSLAAHAQVQAQLKAWTGVEVALGGGITVVPAASSTTPFTINVSGDVSATAGNIITGVSVINSTGTITIGSNSSFQTLNSNCDVVLTGGVSAVGINALRNICETGGTIVSGTALANGSVSSQAINASNGTINAITNPSGSASCSAVGYAGSGTLAATGPAPTVIGVNLSQAGAGAATVNTDGNVSLGSGGTIGRVNASGNLTTGTGATVSAGNYGGTLTLGSSATVNATKVTPNTVTITPASCSSRTF